LFARYAKNPAVNAGTQSLHLIFWNDILFLKKISAMKKFKTLHVLEVVTGRALSEQSTYGDIIELLFFMCRMDMPKSSVPTEVVYILKFANERAYMEALFEQHPVLFDCYTEVQTLRETFDNVWKEWTRQKLATLGEELELAPCAKERLAPIEIVYAHDL
jgi:hypothetical protein